MKVCANDCMLRFDCLCFEVILYIVYIRVYICTFSVTMIN